MTFPRLVREKWGARPPTRAQAKWRGTEITGTEVHHTVTPQDPIPVTPDLDVGESARRIQRYHQVTKGWSDIYYHELIAADGSRAEGRSWGVRAGKQDVIVLAFVGNYDDFPLSERQKESALEVIDIARFFGAGAQVTWHNQRDNTSCPGRNVQSWLEAGLPYTPPPPTLRVPPLYNNLEPVVDVWDPHYQGAYGLTATGGVYAFDGAPFYGSPHGKPYFAGRRAARIVAPGNDHEGNPNERYQGEVKAGKRYVVVTTSGERYAYPE